MPSKTTKTIGGIKFVVKSQKINLGVYKEVSGKVIVKANKKKRNKKGVSVRVINTYFVQNPPPSPSSVQPIQVGPSHSKGPINKRRVVVRHAAGGVGVKGSIPASEIEPTLPKKLVNLPITGVRTEAHITVSGKTEKIVTTKGTVPA